MQHESGMAGGAGTRQPTMNPAEFEALLRSIAEALFPSLPELACSGVTAHPPPSRHQVAFFEYSAGDLSRERIAQVS